MQQRWLTGGLLAINREGACWPPDLLLPNKTGFQGKLGVAFLFTLEIYKLHNVRSLSLKYCWKANALDFYKIMNHVVDCCFCERNQCNEKASTHDHHNTWGILGESDRLYLEPTQNRQNPWITYFWYHFQNPDPNWISKQRWDLLNQISLGTHNASRIYIPFRLFFYFENFTPVMWQF